MNKEMKQRIYNNMETLRKARGITKVEIARRMGTSLSTLCNSDCMPSLDRLDRFCRAAGCQMGDILCGTVDPMDYDIPNSLEGVWPYNLAGAISGYPESTPEREEFVCRVYAPGLLSAVDKLAEREKKLVILRFRSRLTLESTAKEFDVTRERVRQIEAKVLRLLRSPANKSLYCMVPYTDFLTVENERNNAMALALELKSKLSDALGDTNEVETKLKKRPGAGAEYRCP